MRQLLLFLLLVPCVSIVNAQTPAQVPPQSESQLSPQAAYDQAIRPLEITRRSPRNWSEIEHAALKIARERAKDACIARPPDQLSGEDLLALAHLCAFAQQWQPVHQAASNYVAAAQGIAPASDPKGLTELATAFDYKIQASLNLQNSDDAVLTAQTMLRTVPYDEFASEATNSTLYFIRFIHTDQALALLAQRQPTLLSMIKGSPGAGSANSGTASAAGVANAHPSLSLHALYADAIALPGMQQLANQPKAAAESYAELEAALPNNLSSDDGMFIAEKRRQYLLLGSHLPVLTTMGSLQSPDAAAPENLNTAFAYGTVFLLFPDWCNQCVAMAFNSTPVARQLLETDHVRFYALMAQADPLEKRANAPVRNIPLPASKSHRTGQAPSAQSERLHVDQQLAVKSTPDMQLEGTPTLVVPNETLDAFAATDFPLIVATDHNGVIRLIQIAPDDALAPDGDIDQIVHHILATWPPD